jgi:hypothetical protein
MSDFADPSMPGVFEFEGEQVFISSAVLLSNVPVPRLGLFYRPQPAQRIERDPAGSIALASTTTAFRRLTRRIAHRFPATPQRHVIAVVILA